MSLRVACSGARRGFSSASGGDFAKLTTGFSSRIANVQESFFYPVCVGPVPGLRSGAAELRLLRLPRTHVAVARGRRGCRNAHASAAPQVDRVVINVPATTANLGPGFDSFGFALDVWNRVIVQKSDKFEMVIEGEGKDRIVCTEDNLVVQCVQKVRWRAIARRTPRIFQAPSSPAATSRRPAPPPFPATSACVAPFPPYPSRGTRFPVLSSPKRTLFPPRAHPRGAVSRGPVSRQGCSLVCGGGGGRAGDCVPLVAVPALS